MHNLQDLITTFTPYILPAIGIILILYATFKKSTEEKLKGKGIFAEGIVLEQSYRLHSFSDGFSAAPDKITVRFLIRSNEWITTVTKNNFGIYYTNQYKNGESVKVLYNADKPDECVIVSKQSEQASRIVLICFGFVLCIIGIILLFR